MDGEQYPHSRKTSAQMNFFNPLMKKGLITWVLSWTGMS
jgi:hypothetical protein